MSVSDDDITPDRLRLAGWDDECGRFSRDDADFWIFSAGGWWFWANPVDGTDTTRPTGMADIAARLAVSTVHPSPN